MLITKVKDETRAKSFPSRKGLANVFGVGDFYSKLYDEDQHDETEMESDKNETQKRCERDE